MKTTKRMKKQAGTAFVVTFSLLAAGCGKGAASGGKGGDFKCEPPDCHMNPPPPPPPPPSATASAAASAAASSTPVAASATAPAAATKK